MGVIDLSHETIGYAEMYDLCFGSAGQPDGQMTTTSVRAPAPVPRESVITSGSQRGRSSSRRGGAKASVHAYARPAPDPTAFSPNGLVTRVATMPSGRMYKYMMCQMCGNEVCDALASAHVYQMHIKRRDMVQCGYCDYSTTYAVAEVKRHLQTKHIQLRMKIIDRRQDPDVQELYGQWRARCFPAIKTSTQAIGRERERTLTFAQNSQEQDEADQQVSAILQVLSEATRQQQERMEQGLDSSPPRSTLTQAHVTNSKKRVCQRCGEEITHLWENRHIWRHLDEDGCSRYRCVAVGCGFETYLLRTLDSHCVYHGKGLSTKELGLHDRAPELHQRWNSCWEDCFGTEVSLPPNSRPIDQLF